MTNKQRSLLRFVLRRLAAHAKHADDVDLPRLEELAHILSLVVLDASGLADAFDKDEAL